MPAIYFVTKNTFSALLVSAWASCSGIGKTDDADSRQYMTVQWSVSPCAMVSVSMCSGQCLHVQWLVSPCSGQCLHVQWSVSPCAVVSASMCSGQCLHVQWSVPPCAVVSVSMCSG